MTLQIKVYSDYVCPYCYLGKKTLSEAIKDKDVQVEWMPFELRPYPAETLRPEEEHVQNAWKTSILPKARSMGLPMILPDLSPQPHTGIAFEGYHFAKEHGVGVVYNERVMNAFFEEGKNIGDIEVLVEIAKEIGLKSEQFRETLLSRKYKDTQQEALQGAYKANVRAVPTMIIGETVVQGMRSKESLEDIIKKEMDKERSWTMIVEGDSCGIDGCY